MIIAGIISAIASMKASEDAKQSAATQAAGAGAAEGGGGFDMKGVDLPGAGAEDPKKNQSFVSDGSEITKAIMGGGPGINAPGALPVGGPSKINEAIRVADGGLPQAAPVQLPQQTPTADLDVVQIPTDAPPEVTGEGGDKMSLEAKMAMAAQLGSLMRGPGAPPPPGGGGGPGINMKPVFQDTLRSLYG
jgi:hypothetical protein